MYQEARGIYRHSRLRSQRIYRSLVTISRCVEQVYRPVGKYAPEVRQLPKALEEMLIKMLER